MTIEVELPDGSVAEFPDGTSNATIEMALSKYRAKPSPQPMNPANDSDIARLVSGQGPKAWDYNPTNMHALDGVTRQVGAGLDAIQHHGLGALHGTA